MTKLEKDDSIYQVLTYVKAMDMKAVWVDEQGNFVDEKAQEVISSRSASEASSEPKA